MLLLMPSLGVSEKKSIARTRTKEARGCRKRDQTRRTDSKQRCSIRHPLAWSVMRYNRRRRHRRVAAAEWKEGGDSGKFEADTSPWHQKFVQSERFSCCVVCVVRACRSLTSLWLLSIVLPLIVFEADPSRVALHY